MSDFNRFNVDLANWLDTEPAFPFEFGSVFLGEAKLGATWWNPDQPWRRKLAANLPEMYAHRSTTKDITRFGFFPGGAVPALGSFGWISCFGGVRPCVITHRISYNKLVTLAMTSKKSFTPRRVNSLNGGIMRWSRKWGVRGTPLPPIYDWIPLPPIYDKDNVNVYGYLNFIPHDATIDDLCWWNPRHPTQVFGPDGYHTLRVW